MRHANVMRIYFHLHFTESFRIDGKGFSLIHFHLYADPMALAGKIGYNISSFGLVVECRIQRSKGHTENVFVRNQQLKLVESYLSELQKIYSHPFEAEG